MYEVISAHTLYHMRDWDDFDFIYSSIIKAAKKGESQKEFE